MFSRDFTNNIKINQEEIRDRKIALSSKPRKLNVALTTRCNISCLMCETKKINWEIPKKTIDEIILFFPYLERIIWQGGEVFLFDSFKEILQEASRYQNLTHEITTNSHMITPEWLQIIKGINLDLNISIDGFSKDSYEHIRRGSNFCDLLKSLELINNIKKEGCGKTTVLIFTTMKSNFRELERIVDFAKTYNFNRVIIQPVKGNHDTQENIFYHNDSDALEYLRQIKPRLKREAQAQGIELIEWLPSGLSPENNEGKKEGDAKGVSTIKYKDEGLFCYAPWQQLFIEWGGKVYPHCLCLCDGPNANREIGNVVTDSLPEIWNSQRMQAFRKRIISNDFESICSRDCVTGLISDNLRNLPLKPHYTDEPGSERFDAQSAIKRGKEFTARKDYESAFKEIKPLLKDCAFSKDGLKEFNDIYPTYIQQLKSCNSNGEHNAVADKLTELYDFIPRADVFSRNKVLSELEIAQKKLVVTSKMRNIIVTLSTKCNLDCVMCEERRIDWEIPEKTVEEAISYFPYLERIVWQGGEAFLFEGFGRLLDEGGKFPNLRQVITTNGLLINEEWVERLVKNRVDLTFSIDGITKEVYEHIRRGAKFELLMKNLDNFNKVRRKYNNPFINTNLHTVIMKSNYRQLEDFIDFAKEHEFRVLALLFIGGNFNNPENIFHFKDSEALRFIEETIPKVKEKAEKYGIILENRLPVAKDVVLKSEGRKCPVIGNHNFNNKMLCHLPWLQMFIDYDGSIRPDCVCRPEKSIGHVEKDSLAEVWNNEKMQLYRKKIIEGRCTEICNFECTQGQVSDRYLKFS